MTDKDDVLKAVGKMVTQNVAKEVAAGMKTGSDLTGKAKEINDGLNEIISKQLSARIVIFRYDTINASIKRYVSTIENVNPAQLLEQGLHHTIKVWCGGGKYQIKIQAPGVPEKEIDGLEIEGDSLAPVPERTKNLPANALMPSNIPGQYTAGPGFAGLMGYQGNNGPSTTENAVTNKAMGAMEQMTSLLMAKVLGGSDNARSAQDSEMLVKMREEIADLRREKDIALERAAHQKEMAELNAKLEKLADAHNRPPQEDTLTKILAVAATAIPAMMQAKAASDQAQMTMITALMTREHKADPLQAELMKAVISRPGEGDQMMKMYDAMGSIMGTSVQLTQGLVNQMAALQGGERPWWQEAIMTLVGEVGNVAQGLMSRSDRPAGRVVDGEIAEPDEDDEPQLEDAASAAAAAARAHLEEGPQPQQLAGFVGPSRKDSRFSSDSLVKIFGLIEDGQSNPHEIAFRIWKQATSGDAEALAWVRDPTGYTPQILLGFAQRGEMELTEERFEAIQAAIVNLHEHFRTGGSVEAYVTHFGIKLSLPKRVHVVPVQPASAEELEAEQEDDDEDEQEPAAEPVEQVVVETVPTPGLDRVPPPPREDATIRIVPERVPPPQREVQSPVPSAAVNIPTDPRI